MRVGASLGVLALAALTACSSSMESEPNMTTEQWRAVQMREVGSGRDITLRAAAAVLIDEGFLFTMSDFDAGLVAGARGPNAGTGDHATPIFGGDVQFVQVWVSKGAGRTQVRSDIRNLVGRRGDPEAVTRFVAGVERRVASAPPGAGR